MLGGCLRGERCCSVAISDEVGGDVGGPIKLPCCCSLAAAVADCGRYHVFAVWSPLPVDRPRVTSEDTGAGAAAGRGRGVVLMLFRPYESLPCRLQCSTALSCPAWQVAGTSHARQQLHSAVSVLHMPVGSPAKLNLCVWSGGEGVSAVTEGCASVYVHVCVS